jgi:DNA-binding transcriptional MocR family regulator
MSTVPIFQSVGANIYKLPYDEEGLVAEHFEKKLKPGKLNMLYLTPVNAFPTGITHSRRRLKKIKEICLKYNVPIIENDFLRDLWVEPPPAPLKASDEANQIIYIGTMANSFSTGARLAWAVLPNMIINRVCEVKMFTTTCNNNSNELIVNEILSKGYYAEYMDSFRKKLPEIVELADRALAKHIAAMAYWSPKNIIYTTWLEFNSDIDTDKIIQNNPYHVKPGKVFTGKTNHVFVNTLSMTPPEYEQMAYYCKIYGKK